MAAELNQFRPRLEATLILHVGLGKDHFIPLSATYGMLLPHISPRSVAFLGGCPGVCLLLSDLHELPLRDLEPTCFANSLSHLTRLKGPIRDVRSAEDLLSEEDAKNAPREVMRLVNRMMSGDGDVVSGGYSHYPEFGLVPSSLGSDAHFLLLFAAVTQLDLFTERGDPNVVEIIREVR